MSAVNIGQQQKKWVRRTSEARGGEPIRGPVDAFEQLKHRLLREQLEVETDAETQRWLRHAADESAAVAWTTAYPMLVWPELMEEATRAVRVRAERQRRIRARTSSGLAA